MNILRLPAHPYRLLVLTCLAAASLAGCGSDSADKKPAEPPGAASSAPASAPKSGGEAGTLAVPAGGPETIEDFPIPRGAKIIDLGPAGNMSWQFGIGSPDAATVIAFYKKALIDEDCTAKENVAKIRPGSSSTLTTIVIEGYAPTRAAPRASLPKECSMKA